MPRGLTLVIVSVTLLLGLPAAAEAAAAEADPNSCNEATVRQFIQAFVDAVNRGDPARLELLLGDPFRFATDGPAAWNSLNNPTRDQLLAYFRQRHQAHERWQLESLTLRPETAGHFRDFEFEITRQADGLSGTAFGGKGTVDCHASAPALWQWVMAREPFLRARLPIVFALATLVLLGLIGALLIKRSGGRRRAVVA